MQIRLHIAVAALAVVWIGVSPLPAQKKPPANPPAPHASKPPNANANRPKENPAQQLERFQKMSPGDREKALSKLPADRRARVEQQLQNLDKLTPEQRAKRFQRLEALQNLPPQRRQLVRQEIEDLRSLPTGLRRDRLYGEDMKQFSPQEQQLIRDSFPNITRSQPVQP
jgi:Protein of unknown function (DUF3106)